MKTYKKGFFILVIVLVAIPTVVGIRQYTKDLPSGISVESPMYKTDDVQFLYDVTYQKEDKRVMEQQLTEEALEIVQEAREFLVVDLFLYNDDYDREKGLYPEAAEKFTKALVAKREQLPNLPITVITDAVNTLYGSNPSPFFEELKAHNIQVIVTNMAPLRDSNPMYSSVWRSYLQWWQPSQTGFLPNAFNPDGGKGSIGAYLDLANFKANHRKIVMNESRALLTSANITHDGSSFHSNIGFVVEGAILQDIYASEQAVARLSGVTLPAVTFEDATQDGALEVKLLTEGKIKEALLQGLDAASAQSRIKIGVFYMSDHDVTTAIKNASARGVSIQLLLDPNKDAFGLEKNGIPNRQVAAELMKEQSIDVRWYDTHGEQFHSKFLLIDDGQEALLIGGSANFTRRNIADYNLESNLQVKLPSAHPLAQEVHAYFDRLWTNEDGVYTVEFAQYEDHSLWKKFVYRLQEWTGLSTF